MSRVLILEGVGGKAILHAKGLAFGPMFDSKAEAKSFLHFISHTKADRLEWEGDGFPMGAHLFMMWRDAGKKPERECVQFTIKDLTKPEPEPEPDEKPGSWERKWSFFCDMEWYCFPLFLSLDGCNEIGKVLCRDKVIRSDMTDHGGDCLRVWFNTEKSAHAFITRLNAWLVKNWHKAYPRRVPMADRKFADWEWRGHGKVLKVEVRMKWDTDKSDGRKKHLLEDITDPENAPIFFIKRDDGELFIDLEHGSITELGQMLREHLEGWYAIE